MKKEIYDIEGMHCAACSSAVERVTKKLPGVIDSSVNLPMNRLTISYDEKLCTDKNIVDKIKKAGFSASLHIEFEKEIVKEKNNTNNGKSNIWISSVFAALVLIISMGHMLIKGFPIPDIVSPLTHPVNFALLQLILTIPVLISGRRFFTGGFNALIHLNPNMDSLVAISATASFLYSLVITFLLSDNSHLVHNLYYETSAVVVALVSVGKYLESNNKEKTKEAIEKLIKLAPDTAVLVDDNGQWEVPVSKIKLGDTVLIKPGAGIPIDGVVISGSGSVNESMLTGESLPVEKFTGSEVIAGSLSVNGAVYVKVTRTGKDTTLQKIIEFVENAQGKKAPISKTADKVAGVFVPIVIVIALLSSFIWILVGKDLPFAIKIFTSVLVIACPCAMGLATPTAIIVGTGLGASHGILIRSGEALEITHKTNVVIFDKTGTVTAGKPKVTDIISDDNNVLLNIAYSMESFSDHPISKAICSKAKELDIEIIKDLQDFKEITGKGLIAQTSENENLIVGNRKLMLENNIVLDKFNDKVSALESEGKTVVLVAKNNKMVGIVAVADTVKDETFNVIKKLKSMNIKTILLTGDNKRTAEYIGKQIEIDEVVSDVLPTEKADVVKKYQKDNNTVMMVGDGINDAPALVQADIGCAIGNGSDIAIDSADIILMKSDISDVINAITLSKVTIRNIKQNLFWAFCYNVLGIPIAAGLLYPFTGILLSPMIGGLAMSLSSLFVVTNALRLKTVKL